MNKKFLYGFTAGVLSALIICISAFALTRGFVQNGNAANDISAAPGVEEPQATVAASNSLPTTQLFSRKLENITALIDAYFYADVDQETMELGMLRGLVESLDDPYAYYYTADEYKSLLESSSGVYSGIGAQVSQDVNTRIMTIVKPFMGSPAYEAGMKKGDILYKVDGEDITSLDLTEVVARMKGEEGTNVVVTVYREGEDEPIDLNITRAKIETPTVEYRMLDNNIGYIYILEFDEVTVQQFSNAIAALEAQGMEGVIFDLRDNPGGLYDAVIEMIDRLIEKDKLIVYTVDKNDNRDEEYSKTDEKFTLPMVLLVNEYSASASEIFAGAVKDYELGTIVGTKTFGKGIVQSVIPLMVDYSALKITVSHYYTPSGFCLHGLGIEPDVEVELDEELESQLISEREHDNQIDKAVEVLLEKMGK